MQTKKPLKIFLTILYWIDAFIWGLPVTIVGLLTTLIAMIAKGKAYKNGFTYIVEIGGNWGGLELGPVALCGKYHGSSYEEHIHNHEFGHSLQFMYMGIFFIFIVAIPSAIRYWYRRLNPEKVHTDYDSIWFEGQATKFGTAVNNWIKK